MALDEQRKLYPAKADRLNAAVCALKRCAESIPKDTAEYRYWKGVQDEGASYKEEIAQLKATGEFDGRGLFSEFRDWSDDKLGAHNTVVKRATAAGVTVAGLVVGVGGYGAMVATASACLTGVGCLIPASTGALGSLSLSEAWQSSSGITADYQSDEPQRVKRFVLSRDFSMGKEHDFTVRLFKNCFSKAVRI